MKNTFANRPAHPHSPYDGLHPYLYMLGALYVAYGILLIVGGDLIALLGLRTTHDIITKLREEGVKEPRWHFTLTGLLLLTTTILALLVVELL